MIYSQHAEHGDSPVDAFGGRAPRLRAPVCPQRLWVEIATAGGHHTEAWPAHVCVAVAPPAPPPPAMAGPGERGCVDCGVSIEGSHGHTRRCGPCSREERKRIDARSLAKRREARRRCACGASLDERHHLARTCLACRSAAERARVERGRRRPAEASA